MHKNNLMKLHTHFFFLIRVTENFLRQAWWCLPVMYSYLGAKARGLKGHGHPGKGSKHLSQKQM
jgi:hypothetical protein